VVQRYHFLISLGTRGWEGPQFHQPKPAFSPIRGACETHASLPKGGRPRRENLARISQIFKNICNKLQRPQQFFEYSDHKNMPLLLIFETISSEE
jgi:hypothetical protein